MIRPSITVAVEGQVDATVVNRLCVLSGIEILHTYNAHGVSNLDRQIAGYNRAAQHSGWFVLRDLDRAECAPALARRLLPAPAERICFRIAVREVEAWLLADRNGIAGFLGVSHARIPPMPEQLPDPKSSLVAAARRSRSRTVRDDLVPRPGSGRSVGPGYVAMIAETGYPRRSG